MPLLIAILTMTAAPGIATAAPNVIRISIGAQAHYVNPGQILLPVSVTCPATAELAQVDVQVFQEETGTTGFGGVPVNCTGSSTTVIVDVIGCCWTLGPAIANGTGSAAGFFDNDQRRIQIGL